jgi:hypothetical protein
MRGHAQVAHQRHPAAVKLVFDDDPGRIHAATVTEIPQGVGQGQIAAGGMLAKVGSIGGAKPDPAVISVTKDLDRTVFSDNCTVQRGSFLPSTSACAGSGR